MDVKKFQESRAEHEWPPAILWALCILIMTVTFAVDLHLPLGIACTIPYTLAVLVAAFLRSRPVLLSVTLTTSMLTLLGVWYSPKPPQALPSQVLANRGLALFSMWIVALLLDHRNSLQAKQEEVLARIQVLEGLLPICAECKKIRDRSNVWHRLEVFITNHSQAKFTHGICPECSQRALEQYSKDRQQGSTSPLSP